tara:strand:- start:125 stop:379 length:255 start_codon:yes stop_codon:yes gene_type:complete
MRKIFQNLRVFFNNPDSTEFSDFLSIARKDLLTKYKETFLLGYYIHDTNNFQLTGAIFSGDSLDLFVMEVLKNDKQRKITRIKF